MTTSTRATGWPVLGGFLVLASLVACSSDPVDSGGSGGTGGVPVCGAPIGHAGAIQGSWTGNPVNIHELTVPNDPWGGILTVEVSSEVANTEVEIAIDGQEGLVVEDGPADGTKVAFESAPSQTFNIRALLDSPAGNEFPISYLVTWGFSVKPDCYEPNDTSDEAAMIMVGEEVEAYLLQSRGSVAHEPVELNELDEPVEVDEHADWYRFTLANPSALTVDIFQVPSDVTTRFSLHNATPIAIPGAAWLQPDGETSGSLVLPQLQAGDYFLSVTADEFDVGSESSTNDDPLPDHFTTPYRFQLNIPSSPGNGMCYQPTAAGGFIGNKWLNPAQTKMELIASPADPGGGIFLLRVESDKVGPSIQVTVLGERGTVVGDGHANQKTEVSFEAGPTQTFEINITASDSPSASEFPIEYALTYSFSPRLDCHEPNDVYSDAAVIQVDEDIDAYFLQKRGSNGHNEDEHADWYKFTLPTSSPLTLELISLPPDTAMSFTLHDAAVNPLPDPWKQNEGVTSGTKMIPMLSAGEYFLSVTAGTFGEGGTWANTDPPQVEPPHFATPYQFRLSIP
jgi:hypothetical protein